MALFPTVVLFLCLQGMWEQNKKHPNFTPQFPPRLWCQLPSSVMRLLPSSVSPELLLLLWCQTLFLRYDATLPWTSRMAETLLPLWRQNPSSLPQQCQTVSILFDYPHPLWSQAPSSLCDVRLPPTSVIPNSFFLLWCHIPSTICKKEPLPFWYQMTSILYDIRLHLFPKLLES